MGPDTQGRRSAAAWAASREAADGDQAGALSTARAIQDPRVIAEAYGAITSALTVRAEHAAARAALIDAVGQLRTAEPALLAIPALTKTAAAQAVTHSEDVAATLDVARLIATGLDRAYDRDHALSQVAHSWALHGEPERAIEVSADIGNDDSAGAALIAPRSPSWPATALTIKFAMGQRSAGHKPPRSSSMA